MDGDVRSTFAAVAVAVVGRSSMDGGVRSTFAAVQQCQWQLWVGRVVGTVDCYAGWKYDVIPTYRHSSAGPIDTVLYVRRLGQEPLSCY